MLLTTSDLSYWPAFPQITDSPRASAADSGHKAHTTELVPYIPIGRRATTVMHSGTLNRRTA